MQWPPRESQISVQQPYPRPSVYTSLPVSPGAVVKGIHCTARVFIGKVIIGGSCHKYHFCRDKCFVATNTRFSRENTPFVATKVCLS